MTRRMVLMTFNEPHVGQFVNDGERWRVVRVLSWSGIVADIYVESAGVESGVGETPQPR
jgi:hypothetical protein